MKGYKQNGKFIPTTKRNKKALKIADISSRSKVKEDDVIQERAEWDWLVNRNN